MTHSFLPVSVRHPEVPRTHQRDEGSCVDLPQDPDVHSSQTKHLAACKYAPREIPRSAGKNAELRDDAFFPPSKCASSRSPAHSPAGRGILRGSHTVRDVHSSQTRHLAVCKYAAREIPRSAGKSAELRG